MKFVALVSGGKDSCYNILHCMSNGHELSAIANLHPINTEEQELDSFMFQTVGHDIVSYYANCVDENIPVFRQPIGAKTSKNVDLNYTPTATDEIEELYTLLETVKSQIPDIEGVSVGAILSSYQRTRVEDVCARLGLTCLSYLWQRDQLELMQEMCSMSKTASKDSQDGMPLMDARFIKVAAVGLDNSDLGKSLPEAFPKLLKLNEMYDVHICGEGGEFETMVLDAPFFTRGYLKVTVLNYLNKDSASDGVFNAKLGIEFVPRTLDPSVNIVEILQKTLAQPSSLSPKWTSLVDELKNSIRDEEITPATEKQAANTDYVVSVSLVGTKLYISNLHAENASLPVENQCKEVFAQLEKILQEKRVAKSQVLATSLLLADMSSFARVNAVYNQFFNVWNENGPLPPSRACVGSSLITGALQLSCIVELSANLSQNDAGLTLNTNKSGLHVQGRSYWCPCNIGPYSQATWPVNDQNQVTFISGQIPLLASSMAMVNSGKSYGDEIEQSVLALRHFDTLKNTINATKQLSIICYTSKNCMVPIISKTWKLYASQMAELDEGWYDQPDNYTNCLTIVLVSELPRDSLCEWGGVACKSMSESDATYDSDDEDRTETTISAELDVIIQKFGQVVENKECKRCFVNVFSDTIEELLHTLSLFAEIEFHATLYHAPDLNIPNLENVEFYPVKQVYDSDGRQKAFSLQIKATF